MRVENSFLGAAGVGERVERTLWEHGVTHWDGFHADVPGVGEARAASVREFIDAGRQALDDGDARFFADAFPSRAHWRLHDTFDAPCYLDIETTGLDRHAHDVTTVTCHRGGETTTLVRGRDLTADALRRELDAATHLVTYNGAQFDVPFLETAFDLSVDLPNVDLLFPCRRLGLTGGLSGVESALGVERDRPDISGRDAVRLWHEYERGDEDALDTLVAYNREDTVNLATVADRVVADLDRSVFVG